MIDERRRKSFSERDLRGLAPPVDSDGRPHPDLLRKYQTETAERPFSRNDLEKYVRKSLESNIHVFAPILIEAALTPTEKARKIIPEILVRAFKLDSEFLAQIGSGYRVELIPADVEKGTPDRHVIKDTVMASVEGQIALACLKDLFSVHTSPNTRSAAQRYYFKPLNRYLCQNDFGMRRWSEEQNMFVDGDVTVIDGVSRLVTQMVWEVVQNVKTLAESLPKEEFSARHATKEELQTLTRIEAEISRLNDLSDEEITQELSYLTNVDDRHADSFVDPRRPPMNENSRIKERKISDLSIEHDRLKHKINRKGIATESIRLLSENRQTRSLVLSAVPESNASESISRNAQKLAKKLFPQHEGPTQSIEAYQTFLRNADQLVSPLIRVQRTMDLPVPLCHIESLTGPVLLGGSFSAEHFKGLLTDIIREELAKIVFNSNLEFKAQANKFFSSRGKGSPYYYGKSELLDLFLDLGISVASQVLEDDDRKVCDQLKDYPFFKKLSFDLSDKDPAWIKKQLREIHNLRESGLLKYFKKQNQERLWQKEALLGFTKDSADWTSLLTTRELKDIYTRGKQMYWLAKQVWLGNPDRDSDSKFYKSYFSIRWEDYDIYDTHFTAETVKKHINQSGIFIALLLGSEFDQSSLSSEYGLPGNRPNLFEITQLLEDGVDLRSIALAKNKQEYLQKLLQNRGDTDTINLALADWPEELRSVISENELSLYYEYSHDYVLSYPSGLYGYAEAKGKFLELLRIWSVEPETKADLDIRLAIMQQSPDVREWYLHAAIVVDQDVLHRYLLRFNSLRDAQGKFTSMHDALMWGPSSNKLNPNELRAVLETIDTADANRDFTNLIRRYDQESDPFKEQGPIQSLRELKKRVVAIESKIDLSVFPENVQEITIAPGFDASALRNIARRSDFESLVSGELDRTQPFAPHSRLFVTRPLNQALEEALGSQKRGIKGTAHDVKGLFHQVRGLLRDRSVGEKKLEVQDLFSHVPTDLEQDIISALMQQRVFLGDVVEAVLHDKSDPIGWVSGNYTDCCMPFGDPKNNDYMFNPGTQYFTVKYNGRVIAQSVVVDSQDQASGADVIVLDNIEVANNYTKHNALIDRAYRIFWSEYTSKPVKIGTGHSDLIPMGATLEKNEVVFKHPLIYSDARGSSLYNLPKSFEVVPLDQVITFTNVSESDVPTLASIESKSYPAEMVQGADQIKEVLEQSRELELPGAAGSFLVRQGKEAVGYVLLLPEDSEVVSGEIALHVYDMVILPEYRGKGIAKVMMERITDTATAYAGQLEGFRGTIEAEARASTSHALLMNQRTRDWLETKGFTLTRNQKRDKYLGGEDFYLVRFEKR